MRILYLTHYFPPEGNAPASRAFQLARRWVADGHSVQVITCAPNVPDGVVYDGYENRPISRERIEGIDVTRVW
ncbi:MAG: glycosyltransferase WbuB, partial [Planctomycetota bacterium]